MTERWKPLKFSPETQPNSVLLSSNLCFDQIDEQHGNGIRCKKSTIKENQEIIVENALVCSLTNRSRDSKNMPRYCSLCCCFLGSVEEEIHRLFNATTTTAVSSSTTTATTTTTTTSSAEELAREISEHLLKPTTTSSSAQGSSISNHPLWFAEEATTTKLLSKIRCSHCEKNRIIHPQLPQSLEECLLLLTPSLQQEEAEKEEAEIATTTTKLLSKIRCSHCEKNRIIHPQLPQSLEECLLLLTPSPQQEEAEKEEKEIAPSTVLQQFCFIDEAIYCVIRTVLMLFDETLSPFSSSSSSCSKEKIEEEEIKDRFSLAVDNFAVCFDEGVLSSVTMSHERADIWRRANKALNMLLDKILLRFFVLSFSSSSSSSSFSPSSSSSSFSPSSTCWLTLSQFVLLRSVLQTNQHCARTPSPITGFLVSVSASQKEEENEGEKQQEEEEVKEIENNKNKKLAKKILSSLPLIEKDASSHPVALESSALFLQTTRMNHSCTPNCVCGPSLKKRGASIRIVADRDIYVGEELRISYADLDEVKRDKKTVHEKLKKSYGFDCDCENSSSSSS